MSQDRRDDKQRPTYSPPEPEGDATMELSIRDVLNIQTHDHNALTQRPPSGVTQSVTHSVPARRHQPAFDDDDDDDDAASTSVVIPDQRLLDAAAGRPISEPTAEVRLDAALLASIRRTEEIQDNETSTFSIPSDLLKLASQHTPSATRTMPLPAVVGPVTIDLPSGAIEPITMHDEDDTQTRPVGRAPIEAIATVDAHGRLVLPTPTLAVSGLRPGQRVKIVAYIIE